MDLRPKKSPRHGGNGLVNGDPLSSRKHHLLREEKQGRGITTGLIVPDASEAVSVINNAIPKKPHSNIKSNVRLLIVSLRI